MPGRSSCSWRDDPGQRIYLGLSSASTSKAWIAGGAVGAIASGKASTSSADHHGAIAIRRDGAAIAPVASCATRTTGTTGATSTTSGSL
ncbi:hypothetical protein [Cyanobium sp. L1E-Cus]|uniref:hypothetical protein n=1 Tax=Cyanobium sp. L1E-Cus TaxID=2823714 RepID=UPI0020CF44D3|nr:hypothetical protein [Cyanobium sp. L1E-Cus]MCP9823486.1 hypothetical protein [Cyanobium sp. L1E-Cus]